MLPLNLNQLKAVLLSMLLLFYFNIFSQQSSVWGSVDNIKELKSSKKFNDLVNVLNINAVEQALPSSKRDDLLKVYEFSCNCDLEDLYVAMNKLSGVEGIEYAPVYEILQLPNDYYISFSNPYNLDLINAEEAWDITHGDPNLVAAVSDQNYWAVPGNVHEELLGKIVHYDPMNNSSQGHGTAVATLVAGNTNNGIGMSSIGYDIKLGLYRMNYNEVLAASYDGAKVINMSWTSGCLWNPYVEIALEEVYDNGTFMIAAAGNGSTCGGPTNLVYPAAFDKVFAVTSIGPNDNHERYIGNPNSTHQHNITVDLSAPGYDVPVTAAPGWYLYSSGTSFASPQVAGTVGLMLSVNPCLTNEEIEYILKHTSVNIDPLNPDYAGLIGAGRLNAGDAVAMAENYLNNNGGPCGQVSCDPNQSADAGLCQTVFAGYTADYATVHLDGITSGGNGVTISDWTDDNGNTIGSGNSIDFVANANGVSSGDFSANTYTLTYTDENGCSVSDEVEVVVYNVDCSPNPNNKKILVCHNGNTLCISENAVETHLNNHGDDMLGPCGAGCNSAKSSVLKILNNSLNVFPNPSYDVFNIQAANGQLINRIEIYNILGEMIYSNSNENLFVVDLSEHVKGVYFVKSYVGNEMKSTTLIRF
jgi:hypothetical protein